MKSDLHVYKVKMTMLPVLNYHEISLKSRGYECKYYIMTKTGTYLSLKLNLVIFVNFREKNERFIII